MYNVTLSNRSSIFDHRTGFATLAEALEWADGRGGVYVAQITKGDPADIAGHVSISIDDNGEKTVYDHYNGMAWERVTLADIGRMI